MFGGLEQKVMAKQARDVINAMRYVEDAKTKTEKHPWDELNDSERFIWFYQAANALNMEKLNMVIAASIQANPDWCEKFKNISSHDFNTKKNTLCDSFHDLDTDYLLRIKLAEIYNEREAEYKKWEIRAAAELREKDQIIEKQKIEIADLEMMIENLEIQNTVLEGIVLEEEIETASLKKKIEDLKIEVAVMEGIILEEEIDTASLEKKTEDLKIEAAMMEGIVLEQKIKMASLEKKIEDLKIEVAVMEGIILEEEIETASLEKKTKELETEVAVMEDIVLEQKIKMASLEKEIEDLKIKNAALREECVKVSS